MNTLNKKVAIQKLKIQSIAFCLIVFSLTATQAQNAIPSSGGNASGSGGSTSYTIGQIAYTTNLGTNGTIAQGVQQPYEISVINGIENLDFINLSCSVYPNPTTDKLILQIDGDIEAQYSAALYDLNGKLIKTETISENLTEISLETFVSGIYFLNVQKTNIASSQSVKTFKIVKQ